MDMQFWIKAAGLFCLFLACVFIGIEMERSLKQRWQFFRELWELFPVLEKEMIFHHTAVSDALRDAAGNSGTCLGQVLLTAANGIEKRDGKTFACIWREAVAEAVPKKLLSEPEKQVLYRAASAFCSSDTQMQRTLLAQNQDRFRALSIAAEKEYREKGGLVRKLMTAGGAFLVILLI